MKEMKIHGSYPNYMIHPEGRVWNIKRQLWMKTQPNKNGYLMVGVRNAIHKRKMLYVHRLVAELFSPKKEGAAQVNHKDGNKHNNHYKNLEWCTGKENMQHARTEGLLTDQCKFSDDIIQHVLTLVQEGLTQKVVGAILGMSQQHVSQIITGKRRSEGATTIGGTPSRAK